MSSADQQSATNKNADAFDVDVDDNHDMSIDSDRSCEADVSDTSNSELYMNSDFQSEDDRNSTDGEELNEVIKSGRKSHREEFSEFSGKFHVESEFVSSQINQPSNSSLFDTGESSDEDDLEISDSEFFCVGTPNDNHLLQEVDDESREDIEGNSLKIYFIVSFITEFFSSLFSSGHLRNSIHCVALFFYPNEKYETTKCSWFQACSFFISHFVSISLLSPAQLWLIPSAGYT